MLSLINYFQGLGFSELRFTYICMANGNFCRVTNSDEQEVLHTCKYGPIIVCRTIDHLHLSAYRCIYHTWEDVDAQSQYPVHSFL